MVKSTTLYISRSRVKRAHFKAFFASSAICDRKLPCQRRQADSIDEPRRFMYAREVDAERTTCEVFCM